MIIAKLNKREISFCLAHGILYSKKNKRNNLITKQTNENKRENITFMNRHNRRKYISFLHPKDGKTHWLPDGS